MIGFRIGVTVACVIVVSLMVLDQLRLKQMTPGKWALVPVLLGVTIGNAWLA